MKNITINGKEFIVLEVEHHRVIKDLNRYFDGDAFRPDEFENMIINLKKMQRSMVNEKS